MACARLRPRIAQGTNRFARVVHARRLAPTRFQLPWRAGGGFILLRTCGRGAGCWRQLGNGRQGNRGSTRGAAPRANPEQECGYGADGLMGSRRRNRNRTRPQCSVYGSTTSSMPVQLLCCCSLCTSSSSPALVAYPGQHGLYLTESVYLNQVE